MNLLQTYDAVAALPEITLAVLSLALLMYGVFKKGNSFNIVVLWAMLIMAIVATLVVIAGPQREIAFHGAFIVDNFARVMKVLVLFGSSIALAFSVHHMHRAGLARFEYPVLIMLATLGMMLMISANDLISLYVGLELQSLALYVVAAIDRDSAKSSEAGLKYFVLGSLSSGLLLYGASLVYGFTGNTTFPGIMTVISTSGSNIGLIFGLVFIMAGLAFKVSAVPFHMWTPDVYEGAPTPVTAFLASAPKLAAMALFIRFLVQPFAGMVHEWQQVVSFIAIMSMALGAFAAIGQNNIKRLLAYSSIGNIGFALVGLAAGTQLGVASVILYMVIYLFTVVAVFGCVLAMRRNGYQLTAINDLAGLARNNKAYAFIFSMLMLSLAGIPPLAGFFAKYYVFTAAIEVKLYGLAIIGLLSSVVGAFYYLRIVKIIYFDEPVEKFDAADPEVKWVAYAGGIFSLLYIVFAYYFMALASSAAQSLY